MVIVKITVKSDYNNEKKSYNRVNKYTSKQHFVWNKNNSDVYLICIQYNNDKVLNDNIKKWL